MYMSEDALERVQFQRFAPGSTIIEHRNDGKNVVGRIQSATNGGVVHISWHELGLGLMGNRTTGFDPRSWDVCVNEEGGVVFLRRVAPDVGGFDIPWADAFLYTVVLKDR